MKILREVVVTEVEEETTLAGCTVSTQRWQVVVRAPEFVGLTLCTARMGEADWRKVEHHVRRAMDYRSPEDLMAEALQSIVERGEVNEEGSDAALAYSALIESGYE